MNVATEIRTRREISVARIGGTMGKRRTTGDTPSVARLRREERALAEKEMARHREVRARSRAFLSEFNRWAEQRIGATPRARLKWLIEQFLRADLGGASDYQWGEWWVLLDAFAGSGEPRWAEVPKTLEEIGGDKQSIINQISQQLREIEDSSIPVSKIRKVARTPTSKERQQIALCQKHLLDVFSALPRGRLCRHDLGRLEILFNIGPGLPEKSGRRLVRSFYGSLFARVLLSALTHLEIVGVDRLRMCTFRDPQQRVVVDGKFGCGLVFVASKRQAYCSKEHTARAMYLKWKERGSRRGTGRKRRAKKE